MGTDLFSVTNPRPKAPQGYFFMLFRAPGESIKISLNKGVDPETPARVLFNDGPIEILVAHLGRSEVKIAIQAHPDLVILRNELYDVEES